MALIGQRAGLSAADIAAALADSTWRAVAEANRTDLFERGLWGVPSFRVDEQPVLAAAFRVRGIPMLAVMKDGRLVDEAVGFVALQQGAGLLDGQLLLLALAAEGLAEGLARFTEWYRGPERQPAFSRVST